LSHRVSLALRRFTAQDTRKYRPKVAIAGGGVLENLNGEFSQSMKYCIAMILQEDSMFHYEGTYRLRLNLCKHTSFIGEAVQRNVVAPLVEFLKRNEEPLLQCEAAWCLTNICSTESRYTLEVIDAGAIPLLLDLLECGVSQIVVQAMWCLANIAADSTSTRDAVLHMSPVPLMVRIIKKDSSDNLIRTTCWAISNLCRGNPRPLFEAVAPSLPFFTQVINHTDTEILTHSLSALASMSQGHDDEVERVIQCGPVPRIAELLLHEDPSVFSPALRALGNFVSGDHDETQAVIDTGVLEHLAPFLSESGTSEIRKEVNWMLSNIAAGSQSQIQAAIDAGIMELSIQRMCDEDSVVQKEIVWVICNAVDGGSSEQRKKLLSYGAVDALKAFLEPALSGTLSSWSEYKLAWTGLLILAEEGRKLATELDDTETYNVFAPEFASLLELRGSSQAHKSSGEIFNQILSLMNGPSSD